MFDEYLNNERDVLTAPSLLVVCPAFGFCYIRLSSTQRNRIRSSDIWSTQPGALVRGVSSLKAWTSSGESRPPRCLRLRLLAPRVALSRCHTFRKPGHTGDTGGVLSPG